jgi:hypothetical protein
MGESPCGLESVAAMLCGDGTLATIMARAGKQVNRFDRFAYPFAC